MDELSFFSASEKRHNNVREKEKERVIMIEDIILIKLGRLRTCVGEQKRKVFLFFRSALASTSAYRMEM